MVVVMQVYKERVLDAAVNCAREACRTGVKRFVHLSTAQVYNCDKVRGRGRGRGTVSELWSV